MSDFRFNKHIGRDFDGFYYTGFAIVFGTQITPYEYVTVHSDKKHNVIKLEHGNRFDFEPNASRRFPIDGLDMPVGRYDKLPATEHKLDVNGAIYRLAAPTNNPTGSADDE